MSRGSDAIVVDQSGCRLWPYLQWCNRHFPLGRRGVAATHKAFGKRVEPRAPACQTGRVNNRDAHILRESTGTSGVLETARVAVAVLADHDIPHLIIGGIAVQEHGYPRVTIDVDIVVPDVLEAAEWLTTSLTGAFHHVPDHPDRVEDRRTHTFVDLLPAGAVVKVGCKVPFPQPLHAREELQIASLEELIALKLDSWANSPLKRLRDKTDVVELILRRKLPRDLAVNPAVQAIYVEIWDALQAEK